MSSKPKTRADRPIPRENKGLNLSATRGQTFQRCGRLWALGMIETEKGILLPRIEKQYHRDGTAYHLLWEEWLRDGKPVLRNNEIAEWFYAVKDAGHWDDLHPAVDVEWDFHIPTGFGPLFSGTMDIVDFTQDLIGDHKTTGNLFYIRDMDLRQDLQAMTYAHAYFQKQREAQTVRLRWVYVQKVPSKGAHPSLVKEETVTREEAREYWNKTAIPIFKEQWKHWQNKTNPLQIVGNPDSCDAFGGCDARELGVCNMAESAVMKRLREKEAKRKAQAEGKPDPAPEKEQAANEETEHGEASDAFEGAGINPPNPDEEGAQSSTHPVTKLQPKTSTHNFILLFGSRVVKGAAPATNIEELEIIKEIESDIADEFDVMHWKQAPYSQGASEMAARFQAWMATNSLEGIYRVDRFSDYFKSVGPVLLRECSLAFE